MPEIIKYTPYLAITALIVLISYLSLNAVNAGTLNRSKANSNIKNKNESMPTMYNMSKLNEVAAGRIKTASAEWWGINKNDSTEIIQQAIDSKAKTILIGKQGSPWITRPLKLRNNLELVIEKGAVIQAKPGAFHGMNDSLFYANCCSNIIIRGGGLIVMPKADYQDPKKYKQGEWRHAIELLACDTVSIKNLKIIGTGGDGIYVGAQSPKKPKNNWPTYCRNIIIDSCHIDKSHRQAISVIAVENLRISNCKLTNTSGTSPQAGIDFEPNFGAQPLVNCLVENCVINGNKSYGVLLAALNIDDTALPIDITVKNCEIKNNGRGIVLIKPYKPELVDTPANGLIQFIDCQVENSDVRTLEFRDFCSKGYKVLFDGCKMINPVPERSNFSPFLMNISKTVTNNIGGGITFKNTSLDDPQNREIMQVTSKSKNIIFDKMHGTLLFNGKAIKLNNYVYPKK